jgi:hypothetical protein
LAKIAAESIDPIKPANSLRTLNALFKEKDQKKEWRLDKFVRKYSVHGCQDPRDKVYGFLGMVPDWQRPVIDYAKSTHLVFLDVIPIVLNIYSENKPTEVTHNTKFYGHFRVYLENMLKLAWNMKFPDHDQRGPISLFKQIVDVEDELSRNLDDLSLTLMDVIGGFGYEAVDSGVANGGEGVLMGRWWVAVGDQKYYHDCRMRQNPCDNCLRGNSWAMFKRKRLGLGKKRKRRVCSEFCIQMIRIRMIQNLMGMWILMNTDTAYQPYHDQHATL